KRDERERDHAVLREGRDDRGRDPERGQDDDVDLGVPEEPEQVLPEERRAAMADVEEVEREAALELEKDEVDRQRRQREDERERDGEDRVDEQGHAVQGHARGAQLEDRRDEV